MILSFSTQNDFTRSRFEIQAYPTFYLLKGDKIYKYEGLRTISEWTRFVEDGYTYAESRPLPSLPPTDWEKAFAPFKQIYEQLKFLVFNKPLVFLSMVALVFIMTVFTIYVTSWLARKISEADEMEKEALRLEKAADEADAKAAAHQKKD